MSSIFYIYKSLRSGLVPVAQLTLAESTVNVATSEQQIQRVLGILLARPAKISEWSGNDLIKTTPGTPEEHVTARLKRFLPRPYFASRDVPEAFDPRYSSSVEVTH